jgi:hypothetical protein
VVVALLALFIWGPAPRPARGHRHKAVQMLFVPSVEQGTLVRRGDELARFIRSDCGLVLSSQVPTSYAAVIQALGAGQADVAWIPAFAYVLANARYGAEARLQVVRRSTATRWSWFAPRGEPEGSGALAGRRIAVPASVQDAPAIVVERPDRLAPGWVEVPLPVTRDAIGRLVERARRGRRAVSRGSTRRRTTCRRRPQGARGRPARHAARDADRRHHRPAGARAVDRSTTAASWPAATAASTASRGPPGQSFAFSDETSTSGHISRGRCSSAAASPRHVLFAGGHPTWSGRHDGKVAGGATFTATVRHQRARRTLVADARF